MEWKKLDERVEKIGYKRLTFKNFEFPDGERGEFTTWGVRGNNVGVIALTADNQVVIARQFRPGPERILDELPGGGVEDGEDPADAGLRELQEETGYSTDLPLEPLGVACRDAYTNESNYYFLARECHKVSGQELDEHEYVDIGLISITALIENAKTAKMSDGIAVLMAYEKLQELEA